MLNDVDTKQCYFIIKYLFDCIIYLARLKITLFVLFLFLAASRNTLPISVLKIFRKCSRK